MWELPLTILLWEWIVLSVAGVALVLAIIFEGIKRGFKK